METPALLVLAAGMGSRYGGLKQMDPVGPGGETIIDYSIHDAMRAGFTRLIFVIRKEMEAAFRTSIGKRYEHLIDVSYVHQELDMLPAGLLPPSNRVKPWGTGHALLVSRTVVGSRPFAMINADDFYGRGSYEAVAHFLRQAQAGAVPEYGLVGFELRKTLSEHGSVARGLCTCRDGYLETITEMTKIEIRGQGAINTSPDGVTVALTGNEVVSMNMWGLTASLFDALESGFTEFFKTARDNPKAEFYIPTVMDRLIRSGSARCRILPTDETWWGVTYREDKPLVEQRIRTLIKAGVYTSPLENGNHGA